MVGLLGNRVGHSGTFHDPIDTMFSHFPHKDHFPQPADIGLLLILFVTGQWFNFLKCISDVERFDVFFYVIFAEGLSSF